MRSDPTAGRSPASATSPGRPSGTGRLTASEPLSQGARTGHWSGRYVAALIAVFLAGIAIRVALFPGEGLKGDIDQFVVWVNHIALNGLGLCAVDPKEADPRGQCAHGGDGDFDRLPGDGDRWIDRLGSPKGLRYSRISRRYSRAGLQAGFDCFSSRMPSCHLIYLNS